jgi:hypothetical protein
MPQIMVMKHQTPSLLITLLCLLVLASCTPPSIENEPNTTVATAQAAIRFIHTVARPEAQLTFDGTPVGELPWQEASFRPQWIHPYLDYPVGDYELAIVPADSLTTAMVTQSVTLVADHKYTLILYANGPGESRLVWIDETAVLGDRDLTAEPIYILVNLIDEAEPLSVVIDGQMTLADVAYGSYKLGVDPLEAVNGVEIYAGDELLLDYPSVETFLPGAYILQIFDQFMGQTFALPIPTFAGVLTVVEGERATLGGTINGRVPATGTRIHHSLTLDTPTTLAATLVQDEPAESLLDPRIELRLYDENGRLRWQSIEDTAENPIQLAGIELAAGTYQLEVSTTYDVGSSNYTLAIESQ